VTRLTMFVYGICVLIGCGDGQDSTFSESGSAGLRLEDATVNTQLLADLQVFSGAQVFFGHQSVGSNLLEGLAEIETQPGEASLRIVSNEDEPQLAEYSIKHARIGRNGQPRLKVDDFVAMVDGMAGSLPQVAMMKFCYVDFGRETDIDSLLAYYGEAVEDLKERHSDVTLVHVTVPLTSPGNPIKRLINRLIGRESDNDLANIKRQQFNAKLLRLAGTDPVFDLATVESTRPNGSRVTFKSKGQEYYALNPEYTDDGAHLNTSGRSVGAVELVKVIAGALRAQTN
jgi:hypothetical protein